MNEEITEHAEKLEREAAAWRAYAEDSYRPGVQAELDAACAIVDESRQRLADLGYRQTEPGPDCPK